MFSATKLVVAGAIVALFGGVLLTGVLTQQPSDDRLPAAGASATSKTQVQPIDVATSEWEPSVEEGADAASTPDLLPGVDLVTEEVEPGVYRVLSDGVRDLSANVGDVLVTDDGSVWVLKFRPIRDKRGRLIDAENVRVIRLGDAGASLRPEADGRILFLGRDATGSPLVAGFRRGSRMVFDGHEWQQKGRERSPRGFEDCSSGVSRHAGLAADGACWTASEVGLGRYEQDGTGGLFRVEDTGLGLVGRKHRMYLVAADDDGTLWTTLRTFEDEPHRFGGLLAFDGETWRSIPYDGPEDPLMGSRVMDLSIDDDGVVWVLFEDVEDGYSLAAWDGERWTTQGPVGKVKANGFATLPDGSMLLGAGAIFDGRTIRPWDPMPDVVAFPKPLEIGPDGSAWTYLLARGSRTGGLHVITPEAVTATD